MSKWRGGGFRVMTGRPLACVSFLYPPSRSDALALGIGTLRPRMRACTRCCASEAVAGGTRDGRASRSGRDVRWEMPHAPLRAKRRVLGGGRWRAWWYRRAARQWGRQARGAEPGKAGPCRVVVRLGVSGGVGVIPRR
jgi:hypothetical protein